MEKAKREDLWVARKSLERSIAHVVDTMGGLLQPLRDLKDEQKDAVLFLGLLVRVIATTNRPPAKLSDDLLRRFAQEIDSVCPPLGQTAISRDPCFEASTDYAGEAAKCEKEGKSEDDCPRSWGPGGRAMACDMKKIDELKGIITDVLNLQRPPKPTPWPVDEFRDSRTTIDPD